MTVRGVKDTVALNLLENDWSSVVQWMYHQLRKRGKRRGSTESFLPPSLVQNNCSHVLSDGNILRYNSMKTILQYSFENYTLAQFDETMFFFKLMPKRCRYLENENEFSKIPSKPFSGLQNLPIEVNLSK